MAAIKKAMKADVKAMKAMKAMKALVVMPLVPLCCALDRCTFYPGMCKLHSNNNNNSNNHNNHDNDNNNNTSNKAPLREASCPAKLTRGSSRCPATSSWLRTSKSPSLAAPRHPISSGKSQATWRSKPAPTWKASFPSRQQPTSGPVQA
ncbi:unnamed protein product [Polarella glacialis]|uniref:Uncharacterized protein n=1 Tax=Polarella glacialis TaxID=89957 RepID=A0A813L0K0_POLGL|nr:unnamed protein product [Polarella glacialis]